MYRVKLLLEMLTRRIPPREGQRHNITLNEGALEVTLMLGDRYVPIQIKEVDFDMPVRQLVDTIQGLLRKMNEVGKVEIP